MNHPLCLALCLLFLPACGDDHDHDDHDDDPAELACEKVQEPGVALVAATDRSAAPSLTPGQHATVTLVAGEASFVRIDDPGEWLLWSELANVVSGLVEGQSDDDLLPSGSPNSDCPAQVADHYDLDLEATGPWFVRLGPAAVPDAWLMLTPASGHGH